MGENKAPWIDENGFYTYEPLFSYNAYINIVVGGRDIGKTYTKRRDCIREFIKRGYRFVAVVRHISRLKGSGKMQDGFFDKVSAEFPGYAFKTEGVFGFIAAKSEADENGKIPAKAWKLLCYFIAISEAEDLKERTFANIRDIIFDEFCIEKIGHKRYLPREFHQFTKALKSLDRINQDNTRLPLRVWLIGNSCDLVNPYFSAFGITTVPKFGYTWVDEKKTIMLNYIPDIQRPKERLSRTDSLISRYDKEDTITADNAFANGGDTFIERKPSSARFQYAMSLFGNDFGIWYDVKTAICYVNTKIPEGAPFTFVLTMGDMGNDKTMIQKTSAYGKQLANMAMAGRLRYDSPATRERFINLLGYLGVR